MKNKAASNTDATLKYWRLLHSRISRRHCYFTVATALGVVLLLQLLAISQLEDIQKPEKTHIAILCEKFEASRLDKLIQAAIKGTFPRLNDNRVHLHIFVPSEGHAHIADLPQNTLIHITYYKLDPCDGVVKPLMGFVSAERRSVASLCKPFIYQFVGKEVDQLIVLTDNSMMDSNVSEHLHDFKYQLPRKKLIGVLANTASSESCMNDPNSCWPSAWELSSDCFDAIDKANQTTKKDPKTVMFVPDDSVLVLNVKALRSSKIFSARFMEAVVRAYRISGYQKSSIGLPDLLNAFLLSNPKEFQLLPSVWRIAITSKEENTGKASKCDEAITAPSCPHQSYDCLNGRKSRIYWGDTVHIITRTARRPKFFQNCYDSVVRQSYPNIVHLVVTDNPEDEGYIKGKNVQYQVLESQASPYDPLAVCSMCSLLGNNLTDASKGENCTVAELVGSYFENGYTLQDFLQCYCSTPYPMNKYIDSAQKMAGKGWLLVLDDDNKLVSDYAISEMIAHVENQKDLLIWRSCLTEVAPTPNDRHFGISVDMGAIDTSSFMYHSKFAGHSRWKLGLRCGDYWTASSLQNVLQPLWIDNVFVQAQTGRFGYGAGSDFDEKDVSINLEECLTHAKF